MKSLFVIILVMVAAMTNAQDLGKKYNVKIVDDHLVMLTSATDTIRLSLENSGSLSDEAVIFVNTKTPAKETGKFFTDSKGNKYPVCKTSNGKYYYTKTSKTGNPYRVYLSTIN